MSEEKLEPCPFCGEKEEIKMDLSMHGVCYYCLECWAESRRGENSQQAAKYWNSRPIEDALRKRVDELEKITLILTDAMDAFVETGDLKKSQCDGFISLAKEAMKGGK